jgi:hypothetical protein
MSSRRANKVPLSLSLERPGGPAAARSLLLRHHYRADERFGDDPTLRRRRRPLALRHACDHAAPTGATIAVACAPARRRRWRRMSPCPPRARHNRLRQRPSIRQPVCCGTAAITAPVGLCTTDLWRFPRCGIWSCVTPAWGEETDTVQARHRQVHHDRPGFRGHVATHPSSHTGPDLLVAISRSASTRREPSSPNRVQLSGRHRVDARLRKVAA